MPALVSIIVPVYKVEEFLPCCVESILAQSYRDIELILVDDGSPDRCPEMCDGYARLDSRVRVIHTQNRGVSAARNTGMDCASGTYILFVDGDDWIEPNMVEQLVAAMEMTEVQLVSCDLFYDAPGTITHNFHSVEAQQVATAKEVANPYRAILIVPQISGYLCNKLFKKELVTHLRLNEDIAQNEDLLFVAQYLEKVSRMVHVDNKLYHYRMRNVAPPTAITKRLLTATDAYEKILLRYQDKAPHSAWIVERNLLKLFLNLKGRLRLQSGKNAELASLIATGIKKHQKNVLFSSHVSTNEKLNIMLTSIFPGTLLKLKNFILTRRHQKGDWSN